MNVVADVSIGLACPLIVISEPRVGSVATETRYFRAPATGAQLSLSGVAGYVICAPPTGERRVVRDAQLFLIDLPRDVVRAHEGDRVAVVRRAVILRPPRSMQAGGVRAVGAHGRFFQCTKIMQSAISRLFSLRRHRTFLLYVFSPAGRK